MRQVNFIYCDDLQDISGQRTEGMGMELAGSGGNEGHIILGSVECSVLQSMGCSDLAVGIVYLSSSNFGFPLH